MKHRAGTSIANESEPYTPAGIDADTHPTRDEQEEHRQTLERMQ
jgi:hypothetical protein